MYQNYCFPKIHEIIYLCLNIGLFNLLILHLFKKTIKVTFSKINDNK